MGNRTRYPPGTFAWVDLRTTDLAAAKRFYATLFGWSYTNPDAGGGGAYTVASLEGDAVAGLKPLAEEQAPPFWLSYVAVADADAAAARTTNLGGTVHGEPFTTGAGRMTVIADPTGATLCLWQSRDGLGACRVDDPGCLTWNELSTDDPPAAIEFYAGLFGWRIEPIHAAAESAHWMPYFAVTALDEALARVAGGGGLLIDGPRDGRRGRIAIVRDPRGATFGVLEGPIDGR